MKKMSELALKSPKFYIWFPVFIMLVIVTLVAVPTLSGKLTNILQPLTVDTDPESMLLYDNPVRVTHREQKKKFAIYDLMVVGITNTVHKNGAFNAKTLANVYNLVKYAKSLQWLDEDGNTIGVVSVELIAPSTMDNIAQGRPGTVTFNWLMPNVPDNDQEAVEVREKANSQPILKKNLKRHPL